MVANPFVIVPVQSFVAPISSFKLFVVHVAGEGHAGDHEVVTAQNFAVSVDDVGVETADRGADCYHRGDADDDAEQRQKRPQFVGKDRLQGDLQRIGVKGKDCFHNTESGAYTPCKPVKFSLKLRVYTGKTLDTVFSLTAPAVLFTAQERSAAGWEAEELPPNRSAQRTRPVICMTMKSVNIDPIVIASPVNPLRKNA